MSPAMYRDAPSVVPSLTYKRMLGVLNGKITAKGKEEK